MRNNGNLTALRLAPLRIHECAQCELDASLRAGLATKQQQRMVGVRGAQPFRFQTSANSRGFPVTDC
jgi:hypothetical protein